MSNVQKVFDLWHKFKNEIIGVDAAVTITLTLFDDNNGYFNCEEYRRYGDKPSVAKFGGWRLDFGNGKNALDIDYILDNFDFFKPLIPHMFIVIVMDNMVTVNYQNQNGWVDLKLP